ncbi:MAG: EAL domain-containing protein, partial [Vicinamibacteria bacterium]
MSIQLKDILDTELNFQLEAVQYRCLSHYLLTGLPTLNAVLDEIQENIEKTGSIGMIALDLSKNAKLERLYGWQIYDEILVATTKVLKGFIGNFFRKSDILAISREHDDIFLIFLSARRSGASQNLASLQKVASRVKANLEREINRLLADRVKLRIEFRTGHAIVNYDPEIRLERLIYRKIEEAIRLAEDAHSSDLNQKITELQTIMKSGAIRSVFQSIVDLRTGETMGYEALSRGPKGTNMESPVSLFSIAESAHLVSELDRVCLGTALETRKSMSREPMFFLNLHPLTVADPRFSSWFCGDGQVQDPEKIVFEITEGSEITDYEQFRSCLRPFISRGFKVAVDDTGSGYSS